MKNHRVGQASRLSEHYGLRLITRNIRDFDYPGLAKLNQNRQAVPIYLNKMYFLCLPPKFRTQRFGLESTLRTRGRPKKRKEDEKKQPVPFSFSTVKSDVSDYAVVAGIPAKRIGWACKCGTVLKFNESNAVCSYCGNEYNIEGIKLKVAKEA